MKKAIAKVEKEMGAKFGDNSNPLLLSVRSGARASMPGMMDTILNLGINDEAAISLIKKNWQRSLRFTIHTAVSYKCTATLLWT